MVGSIRGRRALAVMLRRGRLAMLQNLMFTRLRAAPDAAFGGWLMPVVPPMVSAATGALLVPHLRGGVPAAGQAAGDGVEVLLEAD